MRSISSFIVPGCGRILRAEEGKDRQVFSQSLGKGQIFGELLLAPAGGDQPLHDADCFFPGGELLYEVFFRVASQKNDAAKFLGFCGENFGGARTGRP